MSKSSKIIQGLKKVKEYLSSSNIEVSQDKIYHNLEELKYTVCSSVSKKERNENLKNLSRAYDNSGCGDSQKREKVLKNLKRPCIYKK